MMKIKILDPLVANQIAAGEVIERPASIVKECLENSLDAGATQIQIDIEQGGMQLIRITDNGHGIAKEDLPYAVMRHGTSKISTSHDLSTITSLGFRGEALASICAVARVTLASQVQDAAHGWQLSAAGTTTTIEEQPIAHLVGTTLTVRDLFFNMPARRRFLRTEKTEFSYIDDVVKRIAISRFNLAIKFTHNQKTCFQLPFINLSAANSEILQDKRIEQLCGREFIQAALKIDMHATGLRLWGWLGEPRIARAQADKQYLYVNGRIVRDKLLNHAIRQAYQPQLDSDRYPAYVLFLECSPACVDVNVHPTKHEIRFHENRLIHDFVTSSLKKVFNSLLTSIDAEPAITLESDKEDKNDDNTANTLCSLDAAISTPSHSSFRNQTYPSVKVTDQAKIYSALQQIQTQTSASALELLLGEPLAVIADQFLMTKKQDVINVILLKEAYSRLFEKSLLKKSIPIKPLLFPLNIHLNEKKLTTLRRYIEILTQLGFQLDIMGQNAITLRHTPVVFERLNFEAFIQLLAEELLPSFKKETVIKLICNCAAISMRPILTTLLQEKLLYSMQQQLSQDDLKQCVRNLDLLLLRKLFE